MVKSNAYYRRIGWTGAIVFSLVAWGLFYYGVRGTFAVDELNELKSQPVPTVTVTATPKPVVIVKTLPPRVVTKTIRVTERASRSMTRGGSKNATLACIRKHESTNNYKAVSKSGTYRGAYQMSVQYSDDWARRAGYESWAEKPADKWPPAVQDAVAANMGRSGWGHWSKWTSYNCPGF